MLTYRLMLRALRTIFIPFRPDATLPLLKPTYELG